MAVNGFKWLSNSCKLLEWLEMAEKSWKWLEWLEMACNCWKWLDKESMGWPYDCIDSLLLSLKTLQCYLRYTHNEYNFYNIELISSVSSKLPSLQDDLINYRHYKNICL